MLYICKHLQDLGLSKNWRPFCLLPDVKGNSLVKDVGIMANMKLNKVLKDQGIVYSIERTNWDNAKHDAIIHGGIDDVKSHVNYEKAKAGSYTDAVLLSASFLNASDITKRYDSPILLPIIAEEKQGKNAIPLGMAKVLQKATGCQVSNAIVQNNKAGHTGANGWHRIANHATFEGSIVQGGESI